MTAPYVTHPSSAREADLPWRRIALGLIVYTFSLRLAFCALVELMPEETYYWNYSRHLDIGYLDHPPMVAWLIRLGTSLFGETEFGVRFGAVCCGIAASFFVFRLTRNLFGETSALLGLLLAQMLPFFFFSGMLMTPDAPLTAAWAATLYFIERALFTAHGRAWLWAGMCLGLGLLSKYSIGLLGAAAFVFVLLDPQSRRWLRRWEPYAAVAIAALVFVPVIVWNAQHDWASFVFQTSRRLADRPQFSLHKLVAGAIVLITPTGLLAVGFAFLSSARPAIRGRQWRFLEIALCVPLAVFFLFSLRHEVKLDWTGAPWVAALPLIAFGMCQRGAGAGVGVGLGEGSSAGMSTRPRVAWPATFAVLALLYAFGLCYLVRGVAGLGFSQHTELLPVGWRDFGRQIDALVEDAYRRHGDRLLVVGMDRYAIASELAFYSHDQSQSVERTTAGHLFGEVGLMYERWFPAQSQTGRTLLIVAWDEHDLDASRLRSQVDDLEPLHEGTLLRNGRVVRRYYYRVARGYHATPTPNAPLPARASAGLVAFQTQCCGHL